jgi:hypothetical protein
LGSALVIPSFPECKEPEAPKWRLGGRPGSGRTALYFVQMIASLRARIGVLAAAALICAGALTARETARIDSPENRPKLMKIGEIGYPPIARAARVSGIVDIEVVVRPDGGVQAAKVKSGPPMLSPAALNSARRSLFDCKSCNAAAPYELVYEFKWVPTDPPKNCDAATLPTPPGPELDQTRHQVSVFAMEVWTCDPSVSITTTYRRVRSAKCLYLWACGLRKIGESTVESP